MSEQIKLYEPGFENYPLRSVIKGNFIFFLGVAIGAWALYLVNSFFSMLFVVYALGMIILFRKLVCTDCYYYGKWCAIGWGKLSALLYKKPGKLENFGKGKWFKIVPLAYSLLALVPALVLIVSMIKDFSFLKAGLLAGVVAYAAYSGSIGRKQSCKDCKMRLICPGCAIK